MLADKSQHYVQKTTMLPQIIIADGGAAERCKVSLGHYRVMPRCNLSIVAGPKRSFAIAIKRRSCQERSRHEIVKFFFHHVCPPCQVGHFFRQEVDRRVSNATTCVLRELQPCFSFASSWKKKLLRIDCNTLRSHLDKSRARNPASELHGQAS